MDTTAVISFSLVPILTKCWYVQRLLKHAWTIAVLSSTQSTAACKANDPKTLVLEVFLWSNIHYSPESHLFCVSFCQFSIPHGKTPQDLRHGVCKWGKWELVKLVQWNSDRSSWVSCCSWFVLAWSCQEFMQRDILGEEPEVQSCKPRAWSWAGGRLRLIEFHFLNPNFLTHPDPESLHFLAGFFGKDVDRRRNSLRPGSQTAGSLPTFSEVHFSGNMLRTNPEGYYNVCMRYKFDLIYMVCFIWFDVIWTDFNHVYSKILLNRKYMGVS